MPGHVNTWQPAASGSDGSRLCQRANSHHSTCILSAGRYTILLCRPSHLYPQPISTPNPSSSLSPSSSPNHSPLIPTLYLLPYITLLPSPFSPPLTLPSSLHLPIPGSHTLVQLGVWGASHVVHCTSSVGLLVLYYYLTVVLYDTYDTSILIFDIYVTIPVSPRSRYTAVYRSSKNTVRQHKYREYHDTIELVPLRNKLNKVIVQQWEHEKQPPSTILFFFGK